MKRILAARGNVRRRLIGQQTHAARKEQIRQQVPYVAIARAPSMPAPVVGSTSVFKVATYNVHRWTGVTGGRKWNPVLATSVLEELDADVIALQEVLRPFDGDDPLEELAEKMQMHLAFVSTRVHRFGELGNAILSRWPMSAVLTVDLSFSRIERRSAVAAQFQSVVGAIYVVATHLALVDRTRSRQVHSLLEHPQLRGPVILLGDMNAWRRCPATRRLDREFTAIHNNHEWPPSFPATRPVLALDRVYARGAHVTSLSAHDSPAARRGSDHLPVVATIELEPEE